MASTYLTRTPSSNSASRTAITLSGWFKRSELNDIETIFQVGAGSGYINWTFNTANQIDFAIQNNNYTSSPPTGFKERKITNRVCRDTSAWYHIVIAVNTTEGTATDRLKIWVNGVQETSWTHETNNTNQNQALPIYVGSTSDPFNIGRQNNGTYFYGGLVSHLHYIDGTAYDATAFGEYDANGVWKIKTSPSVTYGTNGFFILKDGNSVTDQSGNGNNFTVGGGTLTKTEDSPSNVFATFNNLANPNGNFSNGNNTINTSSPARGLSISSLGMSSGKYYCEFKSTTNLDSDGYGIIADPNPTATDQELGHTQYGYAYYSFNGYIRNNDGYTVTSGFNTFGQNDIIGVAVDLDNNKLYFSKNGTWQNSGDPTSGSTGTGAISITAASSTSSGFYHFACSDFSSNTAEYQVNFGNGYFGTTAVSSAGTNASGNGIFEFDVPTGFTALSTKGLNL